MPNRENEHQQNPAVHLIDHTIIPSPNSPSISDTLHFPAARRKWILSQGFDFGDEPLLSIAREFL
jgi:hypothetical protein